VSMNWERTGQTAGGATALVQRPSWSAPAPRKMAPEPSAWVGWCSGRQHRHCSRRPLPPGRRHIALGGPRQASVACDPRRTRWPSRSVHANLPRLRAWRGLTWRAAPHPSARAGNTSSETG